MGEVGAFWCDRLSSVTAAASLLAVVAASFSAINSISICSADSSLSSASAWSVLNSTTAAIKFRITPI